MHSSVLSLPIFSPLQSAKVGPIFLLWPFKKWGKNKFAGLAHFATAFTRLLTRPSLMDFVCITSSVNGGVRWIINRVAEEKKKKETRPAFIYSAIFTYNERGGTQLFSKGELAGEISARSLCVTREALAVKLACG